MSTTYVYLLQFKIQSHLQRKDLNASTTELFPEVKNTQKIYFSFHQNRFFCVCFSPQGLTKLPSWVLWNPLLFMNPSIRFKMVYYSSPKKSKSRVRQSQVCCLHKTILIALLCFVYTFVPLSSLIMSGQSAFFLRKQSF